MPLPYVLIVDDQPINVQLLKRKLEQEDMRIGTAYNGNEALESIQREKPDLILLDVMMPDMNGIEVCQRLQADEATRSIPIIFITAQTSKEGKIEGLGVGAVDYITKPIDLDETLARVQTQLRFVAVNREMLDLQKRLADARRAATIGAMTQGIAHNLNNLLGVAIGYLDLLKAFHDKPDQVLKSAGRVDEALQRIVKIIKQLGTLVLQTRPPLESVGLNELLGGGIKRFKDAYQLPADIQTDNPLGDLPIQSSVELAENALCKILINAWESYGDSGDPSRRISIHTELSEPPNGSPTVKIIIRDHGRGIDPEINAHMFEPFISSKNTVGVGMGLTVARHAMSTLGGDIELTPMPDGGAQATLFHPLGHSNTPARAIHE